MEHSPAAPLGRSAVRHAQALQRADRRRVRAARYGATLVAAAAAYPGMAGPDTWRFPAGVVAGAALVAALSNNRRTRGEAGSDDVAEPVAAKRGRTSPADAPAAGDAAVRTEAERAEAQQAEAARQETARAEAARAEAARQDAARQEAARAEAARQEAARQEAARAEAARQEAARQEAARQEAARQEAARQEAARQEAARQDAVRVAREEAAREGAARTEAALELAAAVEAATSRAADPADRLRAMSAARRAAETAAAAAAAEPKGRRRRAKAEAVEGPPPALSPVERLRAEAARSRTDSPAPADTAPENTTPENTTPENTTPENTTPENTTAEETARPADEPYPSRTLRLQDILGPDEAPETPPYGLPTDAADQVEAVEESPAEDDVDTDPDAPDRDRRRKAEQQSRFVPRSRDRRRKAEVPGARRTEEALRMLAREGWVIRPDLTSVFHGIAHVAIGPPGVFLLDSSHWDGDLVIDAKGVPHTRRLGGAGDLSAPDRIPRQMRMAAAEHHDALVAMLGRQPWVHAVAVVWAPWESPAVESEGVAYVRGDGLTEWLRNRRPVYTREEIAAIVDALTRLPVNVGHEYVR